MYDSCTVRRVTRPPLEKSVYRKTRYNGATKLVGTEVLLGQRGAKIPSQLRRQLLYERSLFRRAMQAPTTPLSALKTPH